MDPFDPKTFASPAIMSENSGTESKTLQVLVFDMGHVFVDFDWEVVCAGFCGVSKKTRDELRQVLAHCATLGYESGKIDTAGFLAELNKGLGTDLSISEFKALWNASFHENQEMAELLCTLKEQVPLYLLSNTNEIHYDFLNDTFNVSRPFNQLILSYKVGHSKPAHPIYHEVMRRSGLPADKHLFVDDLAPNIRAAQEVGLNTIHFQGASDLKERLSKFGFRVK